MQVFFFSFFFEIRGQQLSGIVAFAPVIDDRYCSLPQVRYDLIFFPPRLCTKVQKKKVYLLRGACIFIRSDNGCVYQICLLFCE